MKTLLAWLLWLWMAAVLWAAFFYAPLAAGFIGQSSRILFFHVPLSWTSFVAFIAAAVWSARYLWRRRPADDLAAAAAVELGFVFCILATITGSLWARIMWGAYWNWDPRQTSIVLVMVFYGAYLALRSSIEDEEKRARLSAAYALIGVAVATFLYFILSRITFSLHPEPVINSRGSLEMERRMFRVLLAASLGETALFFWIHNLRRRILALRDRRAEGELSWS